MKIDFRMVSPDALQSIIESFVQREGTDYGLEDYSLNEKVAQVRQQLNAGTAFLSFDPETESINILSSEFETTE